VTSWSVLTSHARLLLCIARDPGVRLRDIAVGPGSTERCAYGIVTDLTAAGYVAKQKDGRRNRYQIQAQDLTTFPPRGTEVSREPEAGIGGQARPRSPDRACRLVRPGELRGPRTRATPAPRQLTGLTNTLLVGSMAPLTRWRPTVILIMYAMYVHHQLPMEDWWR
jgi:hypothetical protein